MEESKETTTSNEQEQKDEGERGVVVVVGGGVSSSEDSKDDGSCTSTTTTGSSEGNKKEEFSTRLRQAVQLYRSVPPSYQHGSAARCVPVQQISSAGCDPVEPPEDIATFKVNSLKLLEKVAGLYAKEKERADRVTTEDSNVR